MSNITLTIPNDDHIALRAFGKALEEMALAHGAEPRKNVGEPLHKLDSAASAATAALERLNNTTNELMQAAPRMMDELRIHGAAEISGKRKEPEIDTTTQQVESLGATHIITEQKLVGDPDPVGDGNFSQGYICTVEEIAHPVDSTGTPWDERIHSTSKVLNADGTWRLRRKPKDMGEAEWAAFIESVKGESNTQTPVMTDEEVNVPEPVEIGEPTREEVDDVEPSVTPPGDDFHTDAEVVTEQTIASIPPVPPVPYVPAVPPLPPLPEAPVVPPLPPLPEAPVVPPLPPLPEVPVVTEWDFPRLMTFLTERHGKIDVATVNTLLAQDGMLSVQELNAHPDKIGPFVARVKAHLGE